MTGFALETVSICKQFGALKVTEMVALRLPAGGRHALIGPNGVGKSTLINLLTGTLKPSRGTIHLNGERIDHLATEQRIARGLGRTFQVNALFPHLTPLESIMLALARRGRLLDRPLLPLRRCSALADEAFELATAVGLRHACLTRTAELPYGRQLLLEIALALAGKPSVLCWTNLLPVCPRRKASKWWRRSRRCRMPSRYCSSSMTWIWCSGLLRRSR